MIQNLSPKDRMSRRAFFLTDFEAPLRKTVPHRGDYHGKFHKGLQRFEEAL